MVEWFDDLTVGMRFKSPEKVVTREEIKRFASEFDPQPYHLDEAAAEQTPLKGLAASGWHKAPRRIREALRIIREPLPFVFVHQGLDQREPTRQSPPRLGSAARHYSGIARHREFAPSS